MSREVARRPTAEFLFVVDKVKRVVSGSRWRAEGLGQTGREPDRGTTDRGHTGPCRTAPGGPPLMRRGGRGGRTGPQA